MKYIAFVFCLIAILGACSNEPIAVKTVTFYQDNGSGEPGEKVTSFTPADHTFHTEIKLNRVDSGLKVKLVWIAADTTEGSNLEIAQSEFSALAANTINGDVTLPNDWPVGTYRLEIYLNDKLAQSEEFQVE